NRNLKKAVYVYLLKYGNMQLQKIQTKIYEIRAQKVMLDFDLAELYEVENRSLKQAVKRNKDRFPDDFMLQLTKEEWQELITNCDKLPESVKFSPATPFAFTEQGIAMLSSVLKSKKSFANKYRHYENVCTHETICVITQRSI